MYLGGRTETIRSCSNESKKFCELMLDNCATCKERAEALRQAITAHKQYTNDVCSLLAGNFLSPLKSLPTCFFIVQAMRGLGVDRHLLGLKLAAECEVQKLPQFFSDRAFVYSRKFLISSSQVRLQEYVELPQITHFYVLFHNIS